jgi:hypothetical protein
MVILAVEARLCLVRYSVRSVESEVRTSCRPLQPLLRATATPARLLPGG